MTTDNHYAHVDGAELKWDFSTYVIPRDYFAHRHVRVNRARATPFLNDFHSRSVFDTVETGEQL